MFPCLDSVVCVVLYLPMSLCDRSQIWGVRYELWSDIVTLVHWVRWSGDTIRGPGSWTLVVSRVWESHGYCIAMNAMCAVTHWALPHCIAKHCHTLSQVVSPHCQIAKEKVQSTPIALLTSFTPLLGYLVAKLAITRSFYCHKCTIHCHVATSLILVVLWQCPGPARLQLARDQLCSVRARDWHQYLESRSGGSPRCLPEEIKS